jgi:hypothetical protein
MFLLIPGFSVGFIAGFSVGSVTPSHRRMREAGYAARPAAAGSGG